MSGGGEHLICGKIAGNAIFKPQTDKSRRGENKRGILSVIQFLKARLDIAAHRGDRLTGKKFFELNGPAGACTADGLGRIQFINAIRQDKRIPRIGPF